MNKRKREHVSDEDYDEDIQGTHRNAGKKIVGDKKFKKVDNKSFKSNSQDKRSFSKKSFGDRKNNYKKPEKSLEYRKPENDKESSQSKKLRFLYNDLMKKTEDEVALKKKEAIVDQILGMIQGVLIKIILKHDGCRIVQGCLKYGNDGHRKVIIDAFANKNMVELAKSKYGHFLALKMVEYLQPHHFTKILDVLFKNFDSIATLREGARVIHEYCHKCKNRKEVDKLIEETLKFDINDPNTHEKIENLAVKIIEKKSHYYPLQHRILAESLRILIPAEREKIFELINTDLNIFVGNYMIPTKEGAKLVCYAIDLMDAKERKNLVKGFKGKIQEWLKIPNSYLHMVLMKICSTLDDTVLVKKSILNELNKDLESLISSPHIADIYLNIFNTEKNAEYLSFTLPDAPNTSKKDEETRRSELISYTIGPLADVLSFSVQEAILNPSLSKLLYLVIKNIFSDSYNDYYPLAKSAVTTVIENYKKNPQKDQKDSIICHPLGHRFVKSLVIDYQKFHGIQEYDEIIESLYELVQTELAVLIQTKAIFVIIAFIENTEYKDQLIQEISGQKHLLKQEGAGMNILKKHCIE